MKTYKHSASFTLFVMLLCINVACKRNMSESMEFQVNPKLLGQHQQDTVLGIRYASPLGFTSSHQELAIRQGAMQNAGEEVEVRAVYQDENAQAYMILSAVTQNRWDQLSTSVSQNELNSEAWTNMHSTTYNYKDFEVQQWLLQNAEWVNFKLIFKTKESRFFQLDYLLPSSIYNEQTAKTIESSIGSFTSFYNK
ncbi:hypothetical protein WJR50_31350 [Catalinimonas sp. 4WD22]|uniref:hypothetical protein n=1 Tax=Catalinimonas locisalis TaxID=3133978 RepID=UPI003100FE44